MERIEGMKWLGTAFILSGILMTNFNIYPNQTRKQKKKDKNTIYQLSNMIFVIDLEDPEHTVVDKIHVDDVPVHILSHPDGKRFFVLGYESFSTFALKNGKLVKLAKSKIPFGQGCFWIHPNGKNILASRSKNWKTKETIAEWFEIKGDKVIFTPNSSNTSALPEDPDIALFPCFATLTPAPATTKATAVEILNVFNPSPPVPQVSNKGSSSSTLRDFSLIEVAIPAISVDVSPFIFKPITNEPN